jgi:Predicted membrane protein (DUF2232)
MVGVLETSNRSKGAGQLMIATVLIALAGGCASALMFASIMSGALISVLLLYLAPLPLMVIALGWGPLSATIASAAATLALAAIFGIPHGIGYVIGVALPSWWLGHLALLGRPVAASGNGSGAPDIEWYPVGRILVWIAGFASLTTFCLLLMLGSDAAAILTAMKHDVLRVLEIRGIAADEKVLDALVAIMPACGVIGMIVTLTINLWLAGKITAMSGRLRRPWPDLKTAALPKAALAALCVAAACTLAGGLLAILAQIVTSALMMAYGFAGFAVLHTLTLALKSRALWLGSAYAAVVLFVWPVIAIVLLGLADAVFGFRQRYLRRQPPPLAAP